MSTENANGLVTYDQEKFYKDPKTGKTYEFPSLFDNPSVTLSVIVPAYCEEVRLPPMLEDCLQYLEKRVKNEPDFSYEVIIVNDGSKDGTADVALQYASKYGSDKVRLLDLYKNRGKGGAVRLGVLSSRGEHILFADADGATLFSDIDKLFAACESRKSEDNANGPTWTFPCVTCGSRAHLEEESIAQRSVFRTFLMLGFHFLVWLFTVKGIKDTQCGFKLFTRSAARLAFPNLHIEGWAFDAELLYICQTLGIPINEVAVTWTEIEGSKVTPVWSWLQMGMDLFLIWVRYLVGSWKITTKNE